ncbi:MAG: ABC transporter permease [Rhodobiaceae bacterium]|nr:ABC transporter permease [Rhodobiaceae bacterium]MCC0018015.1 ABC transporter permease [Rhodobiaceae bacterium]MCC0062033.1 ABC transporter permease [Rhodobiaceae bacterium]
MSAAGMDNGLGARLSRVSAMVQRHWYLLRHSWPRTIELVYWPTVQMLMWGFLQVWLAGESGPVATAAGVFIGGVLLWDVLFRGQLGFSITFLEEMWARNLGHLMMTPLRPSEFVASLMVMSIIRVAIGFIPVTFLALWFFGFNLWSMGLALVAFFANLYLTSWSIGLFVSGLVLRHGLGAENLAWSLSFLLLPLCCVYYPLETLPGWLQSVSLCFAPTYVFEGMRALLLEQTFRSDLMVRALAINVAYFALAAIAFRSLFDGARRTGALLQMGE